MCEMPPGVMFYTCDCCVRRSHHLAYDEYHYRVQEGWLCLQLLYLMVQFVMSVLHGQLLSEAAKATQCGLCLPSCSMNMSFVHLTPNDCNSTGYDCHLSSPLPKVSIAKFSFFRGRAGHLTT